MSERQHKKMRQLERRRWRMFWYRRPWWVPRFAWEYVTRIAMTTLDKDKRWV